MPIKKLSAKLKINDALYVGEYTYGNGHEVPVYEVISHHAFNQIVGYAKFNNKGYGNIYYRGETKQYPGLVPSLYRKFQNRGKADEKINALINKIVKDDKMCRFLNLDGTTQDIKLIVEGMLQHYGIPTRFLDLVDNHWVSLWMGLNNSLQRKVIFTYHTYQERAFPTFDLLCGKKKFVNEDDIYEYVLLIAIPYPTDNKHNGVKRSKYFVEVDLRQALPSVFLRPHAQHGLIAKKIDSVEKYMPIDYFDMANTIVGIIKIRIDYAKKWLGEGSLLKYNNLFPPPSSDVGYDHLLKRTDLFEKSGFEIAKYL